MVPRENIRKKKNWKASWKKFPLFFKYAIFINTETHSMKRKALEINIVKLPECYKHAI